MSSSSSVISRRQPDTVDDPLTAVHALNRMLKLGRPISVRIA